jgi:hypothetical protein
MTKGNYGQVAPNPPTKEDNQQMTTTGNKCQAINRRGRKCNAYALADSDYCFFHDPAKVEERKEARTNGGQARAGRTISRGNTQPREIKSVADVLALLGETVGDVLLLENSLSRAQTIGRLALAMIKAFEISELEQRLQRLEERLQ